MFVRGSAKMMFENVYALSSNYSKNSQTIIAPNQNSIFAPDESITIDNSFRKYAISGMIQSTYLSGLSSKDTADYNIFYDEFGTIMREAAYFKVNYDKAYPALYAKLAPTFTTTKGYTVSGFRANAYGAEFLIFNNTDSILNLDSSSGSYLRIQGITFTQQSDHTLTVDDYFTKRGDLAALALEKDQSVSIRNYKIYNNQQILHILPNIRKNRMINGKKDFNLNAPYIQTQDAANELMGWMISKIMSPRLAVGMSVFAMPTLQLGDIVTINYKDENQQDIIPSTSRFVVYYIDYQKSISGPNMNVYLSEVV